MLKKIVFVSVKVHEALVEAVSAFRERGAADEDLREWEKEHEDTEGSSVWTCPVETRVRS